jgi:GNAT superfamily N-acetyltransferase
VAEEDDRLLGAVCAFPLRAALGEEAKFLSMPGEYLLTSLAVDRDHRGLGIGRALLDRVKAHCVDHRHSMVSLWTGLDYHPAIEFYRSQGFIISGWQHPPGCKFDQCRVYMTWVP